MRKIIEAVVSEGLKVETEIRNLFDLYDKDSIGLVEFENRVDDWILNKVRVGDSFRFGRNKIIVKKIDKKVFKVDGKKGFYDVDYKELREWMLNNVIHDLNIDDWEDVGVVFIK